MEWSSGKWVGSSNRWAFWQKALDFQFRFPNVHTEHRFCARPDPLQSECRRSARCTSRLVSGPVRGKPLKTRLPWLGWQERKREQQALFPDCWPYIYIYTYIYIYIYLPTQAPGWILPSRELRGSTGSPYTGSPYVSIGAGTPFSAVYPPGAAAFASLVASVRLEVALGSQHVGL